MLISQASEERVVWKIDLVKMFHRDLPEILESPEVVEEHGASNHLSTEMFVEL